MAKQLRFEFDGRDYCLEYTRRTVRTMEENGFIGSEVGEKPMMILQLFSGAFLAHHRFEKQDQIEKIYAAMPDKETLIQKLIEMYNEPIEALMADPDEEAGKVEWTASW